MIDIKPFWDVLHTQICGSLIAYAGNKERTINMKVNQVNKRIKIFVDDII